MNLLFVCGRNQRRSPTAEKIYCNTPGIEVRSVGTSESSRRRITKPDILWADLIFVMERKYEARIKSLFPNLTQWPPIHSLDIPDDYEFMDPELIDLIQDSVEGYLPLI